MTKEFLIELQTLKALLSKYHLKDKSNKQEILRGKKYSKALKTLIPIIDYVKDISTLDESIYEGRAPAIFEIVDTEIIILNENKIAVKRSIKYYYNIDSTPNKIDALSPIELENIHQRLPVDWDKKSVPVIENGKYSEIPANVKGKGTALSKMKRLQERYIKEKSALDSNTDVKAFIRCAEYYEYWEREAPKEEKETKYIEVEISRNMKVKSCSNPTDSTEMVINGERKTLLENKKWEFENIYSKEIKGKLRKKYPDIELKFKSGSNEENKLKLIIPKDLYDKLDDDTIKKLKDTGDVEIQ